MADLNNIQDEIAAEFTGDLIDVSYDFTGKTKVPTKPFDPNNPKAHTVINYSGTGIFGLAFNVRDTQVFRIEEQDQKAILFVRQTTSEPQIQDEITYNATTFRVINKNVIPANNGWVLQLRKV